MQDNIVFRTIRRSNRNMLAASLLGVVVLLSLAGWNYRFFYNALFGPFPLQPEQILAARSVSDLPVNYVRVSGDQIVDTGYRWVETDRAGSQLASANYLALVFGSKLLLVKSPDGKLEQPVTGVMVNLPEDARAAVIGDLERRYPGVGEDFLPLMVDATKNVRAEGIFWLGLGVPLLAIFLWGLVTILRRIADPRRHPILRNLSQYGPAEYITARIESDLQSPHDTFGAIHLTAGWLIWLKPSDLRAVRLDDMVWAYKKVVRRRAYGIPISKIHTAQVFDRFGKEIAIPGKEEEINRILEAVFRRAPWIVIGFTDELAKRWKKDRQGFLSAVDRRKMEVIH